jgi:hypothetical protein
MMLNRALDPVLESSAQSADRPVEFHRVEGNTR